MDGETRSCEIRKRRSMITRGTYSSAIAKAEERARSLPRQLAEPFADVDLTDPVQRLSAIAKLATWADRFGLRVLPDPSGDIQELATTVEQIEAPALDSTPLTGFLYGELKEAEGRIGGDRVEPNGARFHDPQAIITISALAIEISCTWWVCDGRPGQAEVQARYRWFNDRANISKLAERLAYSVERVAK